MAIVFFDFDSTVVSKETLDHAIASALDGHPDKDRMVAEIEDITRLGMEGKLDLKESVRRRVGAAPLSKQILENTGLAMIGHVTPGMSELFQWLRENNHEVFIVSGGYIECIRPVAQSLGIDDDHIRVNRFIFSPDGAIVGFDEDALLWSNDGKGPVVAAMRSERPDEMVVMIGDGANDLRTYTSGATEHFIGFGAHVVRPIVKEQAPHFAHSARELKEILHTLLS